MASTLLQLSLMITVIQLTSSQSTYDVIQDCDVSSRESNEQVLHQLMTAISQLTTAVSRLQSDVTELKTDSRHKDATGKLIH